MVCKLVCIFTASALVSITATRLAKLATMKKREEAEKEETMDDTERIKRLKALENLRYQLASCNQRIGVNNETSKYLLKNEERDLLLDLIAKEEVDVTYPSIFQRIRDWLNGEKSGKEDGSQK